MKILAVETSGLVAGAAVIEDKKLIAEYTLNYKMTHSQTIMPIINELCSKLKLDLSSIDYIACSSGPGSFTGLRIGAATAKGLAHGLNKPIIPVPTLDGLAYNIFNTDKIICPIMDARRNQVYSAFYSWNKGKLELLSEYMVESIHKITEMAEKFEKKVIFVGDGIEVHKCILEKNSDFIIAPCSCNLQRAGNIGAIAIDLIEEGKFISGNKFVPFYIRKSQAERELEEKNLSLEEKND